MPGLRASLSWLWRSASKEGETAPLVSCVARGQVNSTSSVPRHVILPHRPPPGAPRNTPHRLTPNRQSKHRFMSPITILYHPGPGALVATQATCEPTRRARGGLVGAGSPDVILTAVAKADAMDRYAPSASSFPRAPGTHRACLDARRPAERMWSTRVRVHAGVAVKTVRA